MIQGGCINSKISDRVCVCVSGIIVHNDASSDHESDPDEDPKGRVKIYWDTGPGSRRFLSRKKVLAPSFAILKKLVAPLFIPEKMCMPHCELKP